MRRHVLLIGLPGSGKSTVGQLVAEALRTRFVDVDKEVEQRTGLSVPQIFAEQGEPRFREIEREIVSDVLNAEPTVVAPGGGWATQPGNLDGATRRALLVYLETEPGVAALRVRDLGGRPLLERDPVGTMATLYGERVATYRRAEVAVRTDARAPAEVAADVVRLARLKGGW